MSLLKKKNKIIFSNKKIIKKKIIEVKHTNNINNNNNNNTNPQIQIQKQTNNKKKKKNSSSIPEMIISTKCRNENKN